MRTTDEYTNWTKRPGGSRNPYLTQTAPTWGCGCGAIGVWLLLRLVLPLLLIGSFLGLAQAGDLTTLWAADELPAVGLRNISDYLATVGGYGVTLLLYVQSIAQLQELYGQQGTRSIISNCVHQLWYPAAEMETARLMSELYGTTLKASPLTSATQGSRQQQGKDGQPYTQTSHNQGASWAWHEGAALTPNEMMALPQGQVLVATQQERRQVFLGERLDPIPLFDRLPGPEGLPIPRPLVRERTYTDWTALAAAAVGGATSATNTPRQTRDQAQPAAPPVVKADDKEADANSNPVTEQPATETPPAQTEAAATLLVDEETDKKMF
jgi:hypothetical protein